MKLKDLIEYYRDNMNELAEIQGSDGSHYICKEGYVFYVNGGIFRQVKGSKEKSPRVIIYKPDKKIAVKIPELVYKYFGDIKKFDSSKYKVYQIDGNNQNNNIDNLIAIPKKPLR